MRCSVTTLAGRNHLVFVLVTGNAVDVFMLCIGLAVQFKSLLVACRAHLVDGIGRIRNGGRHMGLVTTLAVNCSHFRAMWLVALGTERNFAMGIMAEAAGKLGMLALNLFQFDDLLGMTGETLISDIIGQFDNFRGMRIAVAAQTGRKIVVRFAAVALTACGDDLFDRGRVAGMAILTADLGFVSSAIGRNRLRCCRVTFDTIGIAQHRLWINGSGGRQDRHPRQQYR